MAFKYLTRDLDMIDDICWQHYGYTKGAVEAVLKANRTLADQPPVLPSGIEITLPDIGPEPTPQPVRLWD